MNSLKIEMSTDKSRKLINQLEKLEVPWELRYAGNMMFEVWIDGSPSAHTLELDGNIWCIHTLVSIT